MANVPPVASPVAPRTCEPLPHIPIYFGITLRVQVLPHAWLARKNDQGRHPVAALTRDDLYTYSAFLS